MVTTKEKRLGSIFSCLIMIGTVFVGIQIASGPTLGHHTSPEVQTIIDNINATLTKYNSTICQFKGQAGIPSDGVNASEYILEFPLLYNKLFNKSLASFALYPNLLDKVYTDLYIIRDELISLNNEFNDLKTKGNGLDTTVQNLYSYIGSHYDRTHYTEQQIVNALVNDTNFVNSIQQYGNASAIYKFHHQMNTRDVLNITKTLGNSTIKLFAYLEENQTPMKSMGDTSTSLTTNVISENSSMNKINDTNDSLILNDSINNTPMDNIGAVNDSLNSIKAATMAPLKDYLLATHNQIYSTTGQHGGEEAYTLASGANIKKIRIDYDWNKLDDYNTQNRWGWNNGNPQWSLLNDNMRWMNNHGEEGMVNLITYSCPSNAISGIRSDYDTYWVGQAWSPLKIPLYTLTELTLFAAYADHYNLWNDKYGTGSPQYFAQQLIPQLDNHVGVDYNIKTFCVLNEPNAAILKDNFDIITLPYDSYWIIHVIRSIIHHWYEWITGNYNVLVLEILFRTYTTYNLCDDLINTVHNTLLGCHHFQDPKIIVNLYSYLWSWNNPVWMPLLKNGNLNLLGLDLYPEQKINDASGLALAMMFTTSYISHKDWWVVETGGSRDPVTWSKTDDSVPTASGAKINGQLWRVGYQAKVIGYYRIWSKNPKDKSDYDGAYGMWKKLDGNAAPIEMKDINNDIYWKKISEV